MPKGKFTRDAIYFAKVAKSRKENAAARDREYSKEWLYEKYIVLKMACPEIGRLIGRDPKTVWAWLKHYNIETRKRGDATIDAGYGFPKGHTFRTGIPLAQSTKDKIRAASIADGRVPYLKNGVHHLKGRRGSETPNWKGGLTPERQAFYSSDEWKAACSAVWKRDDAKCRRCGSDHRSDKSKRGSFHIHHIVSFMVRELRADVDNLILLCKCCHRFVHSKKNVNKEFLEDVKSAS